VYAYDPDKAGRHPNVEIVFRGQRINPIKLQVTEIKLGCHRRTTRSPTGQPTAPGSTSPTTSSRDRRTGTYVTVGDFDRQLTTAGTEPVGQPAQRGHVGARQPVFVEPFTGLAYLDDRGFTKARVILNWNAPN
jgi:hypothetical protein